MNVCVIPTFNGSAVGVVADPHTEITLVVIKTGAEWIPLTAASASSDEPVVLPECFSLAEVVVCALDAELAACNDATDATVIPPPELHA